MSGHIHYVAFSCDNQSAIIGDYNERVKMIKWQTGANSGDDFDFTQKSLHLGKSVAATICLTKDEKYLLLGSDGLLSVFDTTTIRVKKFKLTDYVAAISLIKDDKKVLIVEQNGNVSIIDLETLKASSIAKNITVVKGLSTLSVINYLWVI